MTDNYNDIINLPLHVSPTRPQMSMMDRAAQFSPFAALTGYDAAIKETGRLTDEKIELGEEELSILNMKFQLLVDSLDEEPEVNIWRSFTCSPRHGYFGKVCWRASIYRHNYPRWIKNSLCAIAYGSLRRYQNTIFFSLRRAS